jgi:hypothetical protein
MKILRNVVVLQACIAILAGCGSRRVADLTGVDCRIYPYEKPADTVVGCAYLDRHGDLIANNDALRDRFDEYGLATVVIGGSLYLAHENGRTSRMYVIDNGPDYFSEGRARYRADSKIGFVDRQLRRVIAAEWDWAGPFEDGIAVVCTGCAEQPVAEDSEHSVMTGGRWGYIDRFGNEVAPLHYERDALPPRESLGAGPRSESMQ